MVLSVVLSWDVATEKSLIRWFCWNSDRALKDSNFFCQECVGFCCALSIALHFLISDKMFSLGCEQEI